MAVALRDQLTALGDKFRATAVPGNWEHTAAWCFGELPNLYEKYCHTRESRYGDEITRRVVAVLKELAADTGTSPESQKRAASLTDRLRRLHEEFGLPELNLRLPGAPRTRTRKAVKAAEQTQRTK
jgi:hypothetical protein